MTDRPSTILRLAAVTLIAAPLITNCADRSYSRAWAKTGVSAERLSTDLEACKAYAADEASTERNIDQDIAAASPDTGGGSVGAVNMNAHLSDQHYGQAVDSCMRDLGYSPAP